jgi:hypothetical protein
MRQVAAALVIARAVHQYERQSSPVAAPPDDAPVTPSTPTARRRPAAPHAWKPTRASG